MRGVILEASIFRGIVRRRDHNAVGQSCFPVAIVSQDRMGNDRRRGVPVVAVHHHGHTIGSQHFERSRQGRF